MIRDFSLWGRVCRDSDGGGGGGGSSGGNYSGKGGQDSPGEGRGGFSGASAPAGSSGGRAGAVGKEGVGGGFSSSGKAPSAPAAASPSSAPSGGRAGGVGLSGVSGGFAQAASSKEFSGRLGSDGRETAMGRGAPAIGAEGVSTSSKSVEAPSPQLSAMSGGLYGAAAAPSYSGKVGSGLDSPAEAGPGPGGRVGGYTGRGSYDTPSETSGVGRGVSGRGFYGGTSIAEGYAQAAAPALAMGIGSVGGRLGMTDAFLDPVVDAIVGAESGGRATAKNPKSTANGVGQFLDKTWSATIAKHRPDLAAAHTRQEIMAMKTDPVLGRAMTKAYVQDNAQHLAKNNVPVNPTTLYAAHFLGPAGATKAYKSDPATPAITVLGADVVSANSSVMAGKSIGQVMGYIEAKMADVTESLGTGHPAIGAQPSKSTAVAAATTVPESPPTPTSRIGNFADPPDESRFAAKYLGVDPQVGINAAHAQLAATLGTTDQLGISGKHAPFGSITGVHTAPVGSIAVQSSTEAEEGRSRAVVDAYDSVFGAADAPAPAYSGFGGEDSPAERGPGPGMGAGTVETDSLGETLTATGIDIGLGALPGIGIGVTAINAGLAIAGKDTLGQTIADALFGGKSRGIISAAGSPTGDGGMMLDLGKTDSVSGSDLESTRPPEVTDFGSKYLGWKGDDTKRPTPREKYYQNRSEYGSREYA